MPTPPLHWLDCGKLTSASSKPRRIQICNLDNYILLLGEIPFCNLDKYFLQREKHSFVFSCIALVGLLTLQMKTKMPPQFKWVTVLTHSYLSLVMATTDQSKNWFRSTSWNLETFEYDETSVRWGSHCYQMSHKNSGWGRLVPCYGVPTPQLASTPGGHFNCHSHECRGLQGGALLSRCPVFTISLHPHLHLLNCHTGKHECLDK